MGTLTLDRYIIDKPLIEILYDIKSKLTNGKLNYIRISGEDIMVTCPSHSDGKEKNADCYIYIGDSESVGYGFYHCFACGDKGSFPKFVGQCFNSSEDFGKKWLIENYGKEIYENVLNLSEINIGKKLNTSIILDKDILNTYQSWHPYLEKRKLSREVCETFNVKYDKSRNQIVFPCNDINGNLVMLTRRSIDSKVFLIDKDVEKPVYCLDYIIKNNIKRVIVCESQINCLYAWSLGYPAIALFGTGTDYQYQLLKKSGITKYVLAFDGDEAGDKGTDRFIRNIGNDVLIDIMKIPRNKDLNDLDKDYISSLLKIDKIKL